MKTNCLNRLKTPILVLGVWISLIGLSTCQSATTATKAEQDNPALSTVHTEPSDANSILKSEIKEKRTPLPAEKDVKATDHNAPAVKDPNEQENDIFDLKISTLLLLNQAYDRIFTPDLISDGGLVDYATLKRKRFDVVDAKRELKKLNPAILMTLSREERIAFWINTYNFCTIQLILDNYPIEPKWYMLIYPDSSIMQIIGAWDKNYFDIQREEYTLREIEQEKLLQRYRDPRICFALSNASIGGAALRNEPYRADRLEEQLDDQVKKYLGSQKGIRWDKDNNILYLSNIFQTHGGAFLKSDLIEIKKFRQRKDQERVWLNFIRPHLSEEDVRYLEDNNFKIKFIEFDWHLNEAPKRSISPPKRNSNNNKD